MKTVNGNQWDACPTAAPRLGSTSIGCTANRSASPSDAGPACRCLLPERPGATPARHSTKEKAPSIGDRPQLTASQRWPTNGSSATRPTTAPTFGSNASSTAAPSRSGKAAKSRLHRNRQNRHITSRFDMMAAGLAWVVPLSPVAGPRPRINPGSSRTCEC
jgi:hypothetical protein